MKATWAHFRTIILILILLVSVLSISVYDFKVQLDWNSTARAEELLQVKSENAAKSFEVTLDNQFAHLKLLAFSIASLESNNQVNMTELLNFAAKETGANRVAVINPNGLGLSSDGTNVNVLDRNYFNKALLGEDHVLENVFSRIDGEQVLVLAVPIYKNNEIVGVLRSSYNFSALGDIFIDNQEDKEYYTYMFEESGKIVATSNPHITTDTTIFDLTQQFNQSDVKHMMTSLINHQSGIIQGVYSNQQHFLYYQPSLENDWFVISSLPNTYIIENTRAIQTSILFFSLKLFLCFACLALYIFYSIKKQNNLLSVSYNALKLSEERYRILTERTNTIIFEYNYETEHFICSPNFYEQFNRDPELLLKFEYDSSSLVYEEDCPIINRIHKLIQEGNTEIQEELRLLKHDGSYAWYMIRISIISARNGKILKIVGDLHNTDSQKKETEALKIIANHDSLTSLCNKKTTHSSIDDYLRENKETCHALMIIDIDNFKGINDNLGHMFGDRVLSDIAEQIKKLFRTSDIVGRIGGDEFVVFLKNVTKEIVEHKANEVCEVFKRSYTGNNRDYKISGSIGIALAPQDGSTFNELYANADSALYMTKKNGKDGYSFYGQNDLVHSQGAFSAHDLEEWSLFTQDSINASFEFFVFSLFYNADDILDTMKLVLNLLAEQFDFDDIHLVIDGNKAPARLVYQLNQTTESSLFITKLIRHINATSNFYDSFDQQGLAFCDDTSKEYDYTVKLYHEAAIASYLQIAYKNGEEIKGFVGFCIHDQARKWTKKEIDSLLLMCKIMGVFLMKEDMRNQLNQG